MATDQTVPAEPARTIDITSQWDGVWASVTAGAPGISNALTFVAGFVAIFAFLQWIWRSSKGNRDNKSLLWGIGMACLLAVPSVIIPIALGVIELVCNVVLGVASGAAGEAGV